MRTIIYSSEITFSIIDTSQLVFNYLISTGILITLWSEQKFIDGQLYLRGGLRPNTDGSMLLVNISGKGDVSLGVGVSGLTAHARFSLIPEEEIA